jgi:hypothetical protein
MTKELIENQIALLKTTLTGVFEEDYNTAQKINELKKWLREGEQEEFNVKCSDMMPDCPGEEGCLMCGS